MDIKIKSFTFYLEYAELISLLTEEEQAYLYLKIINYVFYGKEILDLTDNQNKVWTNLKRPIDKSINQSRNVSKRYSDENTKRDTKQDTNESTKRDTKMGTHNMSMSIVNSNMLNVNNLEELEYEEEKPLKANDSSLLLETTKKVIAHLNKKTSSNFRYNSKTTQTKINARLNEEYTLDDFITVIDKKVKEWKGTEFEKYLRPETLFGNKFESYLNQKNSNETKKYKKVDEQMEILKGVYNGTFKINK